MNFTTEVTLLERFSPYNGDRFKEWLFNNWLVASTMYGLLIITLVGNSLVIAAYIKYPLLRTPTHMLVFNQSLSDVLFSLTVQLFIFIQNSDIGMNLVTYSKVSCLVVIAVVTQSSVGYTANLLTITIERLVAVAQPFHHFRLVTERSMGFIIAIQWLIRLLLTLLPIMGWNIWVPGCICLPFFVLPMNYIVYLTCIPVWVILTLMAAINLALCFIAMQAKKKILPNVPVQQTTEQPRPKPDFKITKMFLMVVGVFYVSLLPINIHTTIQLVSPHMSRLSWMEGFRQLGRLCVMLSPAVNPVIFAWKNQKFRSGIRKILHLREMPESDE